MRCEFESYEIWDVVENGFMDVVDQQEYDTLRRKRMYCSRIKRKIVKLYIKYTKR